MTKSVERILFAVCFLMCSVLIHESAYALPGDYDGDGLSDLAIIDADEPEDKTTVFVRNSSNGSVKPHVFFPFGNYVVSGEYFGDGKTYPGIVSIPQTSPLLRWYIRNPSGQNVVLQYGLKSDNVPNQSDLDCDGITDFTVARNGNFNGVPGYKIWYVALSGSGGAVIETLFGLNGDEVYTGDMNGDGCAELIVLRAGFHWYSRSLFSDTVTQVQWGLPGDIPLLPQDMNGDSVPDYVISRRVGNSQVAFIRQGANDARTLQLGTAGSIPLIGNFFGTNTFAWFERSQGRFGVQAPNNSVLSISFGNPRRGVLRPDGTEVTEDEDGRFTSTGTQAPSNSGDGITCDVQVKRNDGSGGFKNNPENSKNTIKIMYPKAMTGRVASVSAYVNGALFDTLRLGGYEWGNRERYYGRKRLSEYPDNLLVVAKLKDGRNVCVTLPDPQRVYD